MEIKTVTVVGANGTMGTNVAGIFASFGNAKVYMVSRDIEKSKKAAVKAAKSVRADSVVGNLIPADYSMLASCVAESDLVFESTIEDLNVKIAVTDRIAASLRKGAIACTGTSGLSVTALAERFPSDMRGNYFGVHMFNPPYNLTLCEFAPTKYSDKAKLEELKAYLKNVLFRTVVEVKDSPAFLGNRIGFQFINEALQYAMRYKDNGGIDYIDAILGPFTGRSMAPLVTADFVGMDVHKAIVDNIYDNTTDYAHGTFVLPQFAAKLIAEGKLGKKSGEGLYKTMVYADGTKHQFVYDISTDTYRKKMEYVFPFAEEMKAYLQEGDYASAFNALISNHSQEANICLRFLLNYIVYALVVAKLVGHDISAADHVMATGFNWCPPLAMLQALSTVADVPALIKQRFPQEPFAGVDIEGLLSEAKASYYDYRLYFRSAK